MTKEQLADLVTNMRAKQKFSYLWPKNNQDKLECAKAEQEVDEALRKIYLGLWWYAKNCIKQKDKCGIARTLQRQQAINLERVHFSVE